MTISWPCLLIILYVYAQLMWLWVRRQWWARSMATTDLVIFVALSLKNHWFWIVAVPFALWRINQWFLHSSRPWRRVHFSMMRVHAAAAGREEARAEHEKREWDIQDVLATMVATAHPEWTPPRIAFFIAQELAKMQAFHAGPAGVKTEEDGEAEGRRRRRRAVAATGRASSGRSRNF